MRYAGGAAKIRPDDLTAGTAAAAGAGRPRRPGRRRAVRGDVRPLLLDLPRRLLRLGAGPRLPRPEGGQGERRAAAERRVPQHDGLLPRRRPLSELMLDDAGRRELDRLWREFDFITGAPMRQYSSYLWFERAESRFMRGDRVRLRPRRGQGRRVRGQDRAARRGLPGEGPPARGERAGDPGDRGPVPDHRRRASAASSRTGVAAEPRHVEALQAFAERAYRRPLSEDERDGRRRRSTGPSARRTA